MGVRWRQVPALWINESSTKFGALVTFAGVSRWFLIGGRSRTTRQAQGAFFDVMRIRTIKPEFFRHEELFDAERETGLPLRVAFAGMWCASDREGRFQWRPRTLKSEILPYDDVDFSRVLDALLTRGFIVKYRVGDKWYGGTPSWRKHQFVNPREKPSELPDISTAEELDASSTREARVDDACNKEGERKGREGKDSGDRGRSAEIPSLEEILKAADGLAVTKESAQAFFNHYQGNNLWLNQWQRPIDWRLKLRNWQTNSRAMTPGNSGKPNPDAKPENPVAKRIGLEKKIDLLKSEVKRLKDEAPQFHMPGYKENQPKIADLKGKIQETTNALLAL